jgi:hypothetical protein
METTLTVHLPTVDIAITRRKLPGEEADSIAIQMTAVPAVEAAARWFVRPDLVSPWSLMSPLSMFAIWSMWIRAWMPWFPSTTAAPPDGTSRSETPLADRNERSDSR